MRAAVVTRPRTMLAPKLITRAAAIGALRPSPPRTEQFKASGLLVLASVTNRDDDHQDCEGSRRERRILDHGERPEGRRVVDAAKERHHRSGGIQRGCRLDPACSLGNRSPEMRRQLSRP